MKEQQQSLQRLMNALLNLGQTQYNQGDYQSAIQSHNQMLEIARKLKNSVMESLALAWLGCDFRHAGELESALNYFQQRLVLAKTLNDYNAQSETLGWLGDVCNKLLQVEQAINYYTDQLAIVQVLEDKNIEQSLLYTLGSLHYDNQQYFEAIAYFSSALELAHNLSQQTNIANAHYMLGSTYKNLGDKFDAISHYKQAQTLYLKIGNEEWAENSRIQLDELEQKQNIVSQKNLGSDKVMLSNSTQSFLEPQDAISWLNLGHQYFESGNYGAALTCFDHALSYDSSFLNIWFLKSFALHKLNRYEEALASYEYVLEADPNCYSCWLNRGAILCDILGSYEEALVSFDNALALSANCPDTLTSRGIALGNLGRYEEAITSLNQALAFNPEIITAWRKKGALLMKLGVNQEALDSFARAIALNPDDSDLLSMNAHLLRQFGKPNCYEEALTCYKKALAISPNNYQIWYFLDFALYSLKHYDEALNSLNHALALKPDFFDAWLIKGGVLFNFGRAHFRDLAQPELAKAAICLERAVNLNPNSNEAWYNLGNTLWHLYRYEEAIASFDRSIALNPNGAYTWKMRSLALRNLGRLEEAVISIDRALELANNQFPEAWVDRASIVYPLWGYKTAIKNCDDALRLLQSETQSYADHFNYQDDQEAFATLHKEKGDINYQEGRKQSNPFPYWLEAKKSYQKALQYSTLNARNFAANQLEVLQNLTVVCRNIGQNKESQELLRQGTDLLQRRLQTTSSSKMKILLAQLYAGFDQLRVDELVQSGKQVEALELAEERKNVCLSWLRYGWSDTVPSPKYQDIQKLLNRLTAAIYWHISPAAITTFILKYNQPLITRVLQYNQPTPTIFPNVTLDPSVYAAANRQLKDLEDWIAVWKQDYQTHRSERWQTEMSIRLAELGVILEIPHILSHLSGIQHLILLPHGDLHLLPLHVLFPEQFTISYLPSAQVGLDRQQNQHQGFRKLSATSLLNVENPQDNLPHAAVESALLTKLYPHAQHLKNSAVTQSALLHELQFRSGIFHFSGHAYHDWNQPVESSVLLTDSERLSLRDIFQLDLSNYNLVCLSACETGITSKQGLIDEFVGLNSGFLAAGATTVVSSLWKVSDISTTFLMIKFYENLRQISQQEPGAVAVALKVAQKWLRNLTIEEFEQLLDEHKPQLEEVLAHLRTGQRLIFQKSLQQIRQRQPFPFTNPYYWAAFTATGL